TALPPKPTNLPLAPLRGPRAGRASHGAVLPVIECSGKVCEHLSRQRLSEESKQPEETEADKAKRELAERVLLSAQDASMQAARRAAEREGPLDPEYIYDEAFKAAEAAIEAAHVEGGRGCDDRRDPGAGREGGLAVGDLGGNEDGQPAGQPGRGELRGAAGGRPKPCGEPRPPTPTLLLVEEGWGAG
ncbi:unnamed protein product, partial [Prorocentrum cordatum]